MTRQGHPFDPSAEVFHRTMPSRLDERERVIEAVLESLRGRGCRVDDYFDHLFLDELISNAVVHGNRESPHAVVVVRAFVDDEHVGFEVTDEGKGFDWAELEKRPLPPPDDPSPSGRGLALIRASGAQLIFLDRGRRVVVVRSRAAGQAGA